VSDHDQLAGKVALVTGAGGAIGAATALLMLARGASVVAVDRATTSLAQLERDAGSGASLHLVHADVTSEAAVAGYVTEALKAFGRIDVFFNNAGVEGQVAPIADYPLTDFLHVLQVNIVGVFLGMKHVIPAMAARGGGSIINTSSVAGLIGAAGLSAYVASKHAVIGLTRTAAIECGPKNIRVNSVNPGPIESRMMRSIERMAAPDAAKAVHDKFAERIPLGRYGSCDEVASMVAYLASDEAKYLTGGVFVVDGGMTTS
jgi:NAD(P)-dependent dehydrogenase (short-subunit alcohol dehydrogenase family)